MLRRHQPSEARLLTLGFVAHVVSAGAQLLLYKFYYGGGDMLAYYDFGVPISQGLRNDFGSLFPLTVDAFFQGEPRLPFDLIGTGSTSTMSMVAVWLLFLLGDSLLACSVLIAIFSYVSKVLIYRVLRREFPVEFHPTVLAALMLVPSAVFWTSAVLKEPVMLVFFGPLFLALGWFLEGRRLVLASILMVLGGTGVWLLKPYVLLCFAVAAGLWIVWQRVLRDRRNLIVKPIYLILGLTLAVGAFTAADRVLPRGEGQSVSSAMTYQRRASAREVGGSNYYLEEPDADTQSAVQETSFASQLALAPLALLTALFRPFLFEVRNPVQAVNALETTWVLIVFVQVFLRQPVATLIARVTASPALMFCLAFSFLLALGTGLSTANLGTLSRYRAPMMPFFAFLLLALRRPAGEAEQERLAALRR